MLKSIKRLFQRLQWGYSGDKYYGHLASKYQKRREKKAWWHEENKAVKSYLDALPRRIKVLDMPFGTGRFVPFYLEREMEVFGLDASPEMLGAARELLGDDFQRCQTTVGDAAKLPYEDKAFDLVVCFRFLQSIVPYAVVRKSLMELGRVCKSHALLELKVRHDHMKDVAAPKDNKSIRDAFKRADIERLLNGHGFEIVEEIPISRRKTHTLTAFACKPL